jgi:hypothetical protein
MARAFESEFSSLLAECITIQTIWNLPWYIGYQAELGRFLSGSIILHQAENHGLRVKL